MPKRPTSEMWLAARQQWEANPKENFETIGKSLGVSRVAASKRAAKEGWARPQNLRQILERAQLRADVKVSPLNQPGLGTAGDKAADVVLTRTPLTMAPEARPQVSPTCPQTVTSEKPNAGAVSPVSPVVPTTTELDATRTRRRGDDLGNMASRSNCAAYQGYGFQTGFQQTGVAASCNRTGTQERSTQRGSHPIEVVTACKECRHLLRRGTCGEPVAAGLVTHFGIVWPPEGHGAGCPAFVGTATVEADVDRQAVGLATAVIESESSEGLEAVCAGEMSAKSTAKRTKPSSRQAKQALNYAASDGPRPEPGTVADSQPNCSPEAEQVPNGDPDADTLDELVDQLHAENIRMAHELEAIHADDPRAETLKWRRAYDNAARQQSVAMDRAAQAQRREKWSMDQLRRISRAVRVEDPAQLARTVEKLVAKSKEAEA